MTAPRQHLVQFYERDAYLVDSVARFVGTGLGAGDAVVVIATELHIAELSERLAKRGVDVYAEGLEGRFVALDAAAMLAELVVDEHVDALRFREIVGGAIARAAGPQGVPVRAFGEMVSLLWAEGMREQSIELERLWNELAQSLPFTLLCAYPIVTFDDDRDGAAFHDICAQHSDIIPAESYSTLGSEEERSREIAQLQRKARILELEVAHRKEMQEALRNVALENARLYDAEHRARGEAESASRSKDEFLAMLAHELRNPLSAVRNAVLSARFDPRRREHAMEIAARGVDQLTHLVDDLLDVARITRGRISLDKRLVSIRTVVESAVESTRNLIEERAHTLVLSLPGPEAQIDADATRLEQILVNLISNAAKYTDPHGQILVTASHAGGEAVLRVHDSGMGIAPEMLPRIFDLFAQSDRALDRSEGGLGIGLTIVKRLAELHGGSVHAHSDGPELGADFEVRLPGVIVRRQQGPSESDPSGEASDRGVRVLVVEDNFDVAESLAMLLEAFGHHAVMVHDGSRALDAVVRESFDLVLMDIGLPGMDGYQTAQQMRRELGVRTTLIALTGYGRDDDRERSLAAGFDLHLVKPVDPDALKQLLAQVGSPRK